MLNLLSLQNWLTSSISKYKGPKPLLFVDLLFHIHLSINYYTGKIMTVQNNSSLSVDSSNLTNNTTKVTTMLTVNTADCSDFRATALAMTANRSQKAKFKALSNAYPAGIEFIAGLSVVKISFGLVLNFGQFSILNGSTVGESAQVWNFMADLIENEGLNSISLINAAAKAQRKIIATAVDSKNVLKKATRSGDIVYAKVRTSLHPMLHSSDGIPSVVINANCPSASMLKVVDGNFVNVGRTPMPFSAACRVVLTTDESVCGIAHMLVDPYIWHALCEGDSDGDGIAASRADITADEAKAINNSLMGVAGYRHIYGANVPFADFMSATDKHGKKDPAANVAMISNTIKNPDSAQEEPIPLTPEVLGDFASRVANHYRSAVGTGYGICSKLIFHAADVAASGDEAKLKSLTEASLVAWRLLYEGLGLSGYSREASYVYDVLNKASVDTNGPGMVAVHKTTGEVEVTFAKVVSNNPDDYTITSGAHILSQAKAFAGLENVPVGVFQNIILARTVTRVVPKLEGFGSLGESGYWNNVIPAAIKYGTLRRISQGDDRVAEMLNDFEIAEMESNGENVGKPMTVHFTETVCENAFDNKLLFTVAQNISDFHAIIHAGKVARQDH